MDLQRNQKHTSAYCLSLTLSKLPALFVIHIKTLGLYNYAALCKPV